MTKRKIDTSSTSTSYWESLLREEGLSMDAGRDPGHRGKLVYVGDTADIETIDEILARRKTGRVRPQGAGPDLND